MTTKRYVLGFMFNEDQTQVALILKNRPEWQAGLLNGIGGKIEEGEHPWDAMVREFKEETGYTSGYETWVHRLTLIFVDDAMGGRAEVYVYLGTGDITLLRTMEDEKVCVVAWKVVQPDGCIHNLEWMVPLLLDKKMPNATEMIIQKMDY